MSTGLEQSTRSGRGRLFVVAGIVVVAVVAIAVVATRWLINDRSEMIATDEVIANYRSSTSGATPDASDLSSPTVDTRGAPTTTAAGGTGADAVVVPATGVYRYFTDGFEEVDALGGAHHDYPDETTITVTSAGCGVHLRWDVLRERRDEWAICATSDGIVLQPAGVQYHEFFQQPDEEKVTCTSAVLVVPVDPAAMPITDQSCLLDEDPWRPSWEVLEHGSRSVAGSEVAVTHVRMTVSDDDEYWEHTTIDWFLAPDGLPVEATGTKDSSSPSPIGAVIYTEQFQLQLVSLVPET